MKKKQRWIAALLAIMLLLTPGCEKSSNSIKDKIVVPTAPATETTEPVSAEDTLQSLRQTTAQMHQLFAVAYFGYHYSDIMDIPVDPLVAIEETSPEFLVKMPFLQEISADRVIGDQGDLFCIIPLEENATVAVSRGYWDDENGQYIYDDMVYSSMSGEPILLFCNYGWESDTQVYISGPSGETFWYPGTDDNEFVTEGDFYDISPYADMLKAEHTWLKDCEWTLPTLDQLIGTSWSWNRYLADGTEESCTMTIENDFISVIWNDGEEHVYHDAPWELRYEEDTAILSIDFGEMAGVLRYNLLYEENYSELYVSIDVTQENFPVGWEPLSRFLTMNAIPDTLSLIGTWDLVWTEVEGDINATEPNSQIIEITTDYEGNYWISYTDNERPDWSFYGKRLEFVDDELYSDCGNNQWYATVDYIGFEGTEFSLTLLPEGTLLLRRYWEFEGFRNVAHGWYARISDDDPYTYAISQGWRYPELWELLNTGWSSYIGYAMDLLDDSVPGDNGGRATIYDVDENGVYTKSYTGSWQYDAGYLHLSLVPLENGYQIDDSFPVLMLDGELWIGRNSDGLGLPHFYSDTLADVLIQPMG